MGDGLLRMNDLGVAKTGVIPAVCWPTCQLSCRLTADLPIRLTKGRLQNSPYFCVFKYTRAVKQKVWNEAENRERDWGETLFLSRLTRLARFARIRVLRHALPISLLILRKKPTVLQSRLRAVPLLHLPNFVSRSPTARGKFEKEYGGQSDAQIGQS